MGVESLPDWAKRSPDGEGYIVDVTSLLFSIQLTELCVVELLHLESGGRRLTRDELIDQWKAEVANLRKCRRMDVVRASYHTFYNHKGDTRDSFGMRWSAAYQHVKYLFTVDLEGAWLHLIDPLRHALRTRFETRRLLRKPEPSAEEIRKMLCDWYGGLRVE